MRKRSKSNPYFAVDLNGKNITDEYGKIYTIDKFKQFVENSKHSLDMTLMAQRLIRFNYDLNKLEEFYK